MKTHLWTQHRCKGDGEVAWMRVMGWVSALTYGGKERSPREVSHMLSGPFQSICWNAAQKSL